MGSGLWEGVFKAGGEFGISCSDRQDARYPADEAQKASSHCLNQQEIIRPFCNTSW